VPFSLSKKTINPERKPSGPPQAPPLPLMMLLSYLYLALWASPTIIPLGHPLFSSYHHLHSCCSRVTSPLYYSHFYYPETDIFSTTIAPLCSSDLTRQTTFPQSLRGLVIVAPVSHLLESRTFLSTETISNCCYELQRRRHRLLPLRFLIESAGWTPYSVAPTRFPPRTSF